MSKLRENIDHYLRLLERFEIHAHAYLGLLHPDFIQTEYPNALHPHGQKSTLGEALQRIQLGRAMLEKQKFFITSYLERDHRAVAEATWSGTLLVDAGVLKAGQKLNANFCMCFEFKDEKIFRQSNYDCFEAIV